MIDKTTGLQMTQKYELCGKNASCEVKFDEEFTDDGQHFLHLEFSFGSTFSDEMDFNELYSITEKAKIDMNELNVIRKALDGKNWKVVLSEGVTFECFHEIDIKGYWSRNHKDQIDLGLIKECYNDCEKCTICHNHYESDCGWCEGCHKHPCIKTNGRKDLLNALEN